MGTSWSLTCFTWKSAPGYWEIPCDSATKLDHFPVHSLHSKHFGNKNQLVFSLDQCKEQSHAWSFRSKFFDCANTMGCWDKHVNRKCKACGMCMSQWDFDLWINHYLYRSIGFHMPIDSLRSHICIWIQSNHVFFIQTRYQQSWLFFSTNVFLHPCPMFFSAPKTRVFWLSKSTCPKKECVWAIYNW